MEYDYYPEFKDNKFYEKFTKRKEYWLNRQRSIAQKCSTDEDQVFQLMPQQKLLPKVISPNSPYKNLLIFQGVGIGKTCTALQIAEAFQPYITRLNNRIDEGLVRSRNKPSIYIIGHDAAIQNFKSTLLGKCLNNKYISKEETKALEELSKDTSEKIREIYKSKVREYNRRLANTGHYKFMGYRVFQAQTIGEKIRNPSGKGFLRDPHTGQYKRKRRPPFINRLDNCLIIVDEAHNLVNSIESNDWLKAIKHIYKRSKNIRLILLTATPMTHRPREIVDLLNLVSLDDPKSKPLRPRDLFKDNKLLEGAEKAIAKKSRGYVSYLRGYNPYTYPERIDRGVLIRPFKYTKLVLCPMSNFHYQTYKYVFNDVGVSAQEWGLMNMVFPNPRNKRIGVYKKHEILDLDTGSTNKWKKQHLIEFVTLPNGERQITGDILLKRNIRKYSSKFWTMLDDLEQNVYKKNGSSFIYSRKVTGIGTRLIRQILLRNGYLEYTLNTTIDEQVNISHARCYYCGKFGKNHNEDHQYYPARFIVLDSDKEKKEMNQLIETFNSQENDDSHMIKIILGSPVTRESIDFKRILYTTIITFHDNFLLHEQIIGRSARHCSHGDLPLNKQRVYISRYVTSFPSNVKGLTYEEQKYFEGEKYHMLIKKVERVLKINAIDCALNKKANVFPSEIKKYKDCETKRNPTKCSQFCDYTNCDYQCKYNPPSIGLSFHDLTIDTYDVYYYQHELNTLKEFIKYLFTRKSVWNMDEIIYVMYHDNKRLFRTSNVSSKDIIKPQILSEYKIHDHPWSLDEKLLSLRKKLHYIDHKYIYLALQELIEYKELVINSQDAKGTIIQQTGNYLFQPNNIPDQNINITKRNLPEYDVNQTDISLTSFMNKFYKSLSEDVIVVTIRDIKSRLCDLDIKNDYQMIATILGSLSLENQIEILQDAIVLSQKPKINLDCKLYTRKIFKFYQDYLIDNKKFSGRYDYRSASLIVKEIYDDPNVKVIGHILGKEPKCYIDGKWLNCIYDLFSRRKDKNKDYENNDYIIGYIDKTKHGKMVFKLQYTNPSLIKSKDKRRATKGFICIQHNNKKELLRIANKLGVKGMTNKNTIKDICMELEGKLRENEINERVKGKKSNKKWFYEYIEILNK